MTQKQIVALGGGGFLMEPDITLLDDYIISLTGKKHPKICFVPTASGDSDYNIARFYTNFPASRAQSTHLSMFRMHLVPNLRDLIMSQDIIYVGGGNTANMLAIWRLHGLDKVLHEAYEKGIVLCGVSAGAICWFESGVTDSFAPELAPLTNGLAFLTGSFCPHYDGEAKRRPAFHNLVKNVLPPGYAADDSCAMHFIDGNLHQVISSQSHAHAYKVELSGDNIVETKIKAKYLG